ncbi:phosphoethanolamine N-methyltransferase [Nephila pilipes]|uniref:phosphoethanolamine N-methyltransferase n=1 Tax=Nephila pilipes TaxID=299642 RepID=A0A8X6Q5P1_NEPPI|nr:phosphoethanolamine N-methyltransferase [Nephila pilipes]
MSGSSFGTRVRMHEYWQNFAPSLESMMLDKTASSIHIDEQEEIFSLLPSIENKRVLELGAGIGRYTGLLASVAHHLTAVDFMEEYISVNEKNHGHLNNITYIAADVLDLQLPPKRFGTIFSNWLFMYLTDQECVSLLQKILQWLDDDGWLFFRESCFHSSGNMSRTTNPTFYRTPADYASLLESAWKSSSDSILEPSEDGYGYKIINVGSLRSYIKHKNNSYQIYFLAKKVDKLMDSKDNFQSFLDKKQYSRQGVLRYEWIFGKTFLSTGGLSTTKKYISRLDLKPGQKVLDVGCGIGGHSFYMAENYGVEVLGVDLSVNMMTVATEYLSERPHLNNKVKFVICDITKSEYDDGSFDTIYSRDTLLHIPNKDELFKNFERWLKPGGKILFTDYTRSEKENSSHFEKYINDRGYNLLTLHQYKELLEKSGFVNVKAEDATEEFLNALHAELDRLRKEKEAFLREFTEEDFTYLEENWTSKIKRVAEGNQTWTACYAEKPHA